MAGRDPPYVRDKAGRCAQGTKVNSKETKARKSFSTEARRKQKGRGKAKGFYEKSFRF